MQKTRKYNIQYPFHNNEWRNEKDPNDIDDHPFSKNYDLSNSF